MRYRVYRQYGPNYQKYMKKHKIPGKVYTHEWKNFGHNRTLSAQAAKQTLSDLKFPLENSYLAIRNERRSRRQNTHCRRGAARGRAFAGRPGRARALPLDLRRDAFRLRQPARGPADEPARQPSGLQGLGRRPIGCRPDHRHLARAAGRLGRALPVRRADHGRRHVRAGLHPLRHLRREAGRGLAPPIATASWRCPICANGPPRPSWSPKRSRNWTSSSRARPAARRTGRSHLPLACRRTASGRRRSARTPKPYRSRRLGR